MPTSNATERCEESNYRWKSNSQPAPTSAPPEIRQPLPAAAFASPPSPPPPRPEPRSADLRRAHRAPDPMPLPLKCARAGDTWADVVSSLVVSTLTSSWLGWLADEATGAGPRTATDGLGLSLGGRPWIGLCHSTLTTGSKFGQGLPQFGEFLASSFKSSKTPAGEELW